MRIVCSYSSFTIENLIDQSDSFQVLPHICHTNVWQSAFHPYYRQNQVPPAGFELRQNFSKCSVLVSLSNKILCFALVL